MQVLEHWHKLAESISALISGVETEIGAKNFTELSDRHALSKIDKKLYEALEVAQKAISALEDE